MSAALHLQPEQLPVLPVRPARPELRLVEGGRSAARPSASVYRRRRIVAALALIVVVGALLALTLQLVDGASGAVTASGPGGAAASTVVVHIVEPGDTMWSIARSLQPSGDVRSLVDELVSANGGASLQIGDQIVLPVRA